MKPENGPLWVAFGVWLLMVLAVSMVAALMCMQDHLVYITRVV